MTDFRPDTSVRLALAGPVTIPGLNASRRATGGALSVFETSIDDAGPPLHVHDREDEGFYVLDGDLSVRCGGDVFDACGAALCSCPATAARATPRPGA